jgi:hypothetical protein
MEVSGQTSDKSSDRKETRVRLDQLVQQAMLDQLEQQAPHQTLLARLDRLAQLAQQELLVDLQVRLALLSLALQAHKATRLVFNIYLQQAPQ